MGILICDPFNSLQVPILEGEESDGDVPRLGRGRLGSRASAARRERRTRNNSLRLIKIFPNVKDTRVCARFSIRVSEREPEPPGPDGGWGWLVCLAAFYCVSVLDGDIIHSN